MTENPPMLAAIRGCLIGTAVGDALGLPAEGLSQQRAARWWKGDWRMRLLPGRGMVSDDTEHTYAVAEALSVAHCDVERFRRVLAGKLRWWFLALPAGVGMATARACIKLWLGFAPSKNGVFSAGNGPAMRSALIGVFFRDDPVRRREFVGASARITHTDPLAETAALAVAEAAACAANGGDRDAFVLSLPDLMDSDKWRNAVSQFAGHLQAGSSTRAFACAMGLERGVSGYALHTVPVALYAWLRYHDESTVVRAQLRWRYRHRGRYCRSTRWCDARLRLHSGGLAESPLGLAAFNVPFGYRCDRFGRIGSCSRHFLAVPVLAKCILPFHHPRTRLPPIASADCFRLTDASNQ